MNEFQYDMSIFPYANDEFPTRRGKLRSTKSENYMTTKTLYNYKGRVLFRFVCKSYPYGTRGKGFISNEDIVVEYPNVKDNFKKIYEVGLVRARYSHQNKGGKSNPQIRLIDYTVKYFIFHKNGKPRMKYVDKKKGNKTVHQVYVLKNDEYELHSETYDMNKKQKYDTFLNAGAPLYVTNDELYAFTKSKKDEEKYISEKLD